MYETFTLYLMCDDVFLPVVCQVLTPEVAKIGFQELYRVFAVQCHPEVCFGFAPNSCALPHKGVLGGSGGELCCRSALQLEHFSVSVEIAALDNFQLLPSDPVMREPVCKDEIDRPSVA